MTSNTSLVDVSPHLSQENLSDSLSSWFGGPTTFTRWEYVSETGKGDSYLSELMRIKIFGTTENSEEKNVQVILKAIPRSVSRRLTYRCDEFFQNEISFYRQVLPELLRFQSSRNLEGFANCPKIFFSHCDGTIDVICLEDAALSGFKSAVRQEGIDLDHCKITFKTLAKFHSLSFALKDQNPETFKKIEGDLTETYYDTRLLGWYQRFWTRICGIAVDAVEKEFPNSVYVDKIKAFAVPGRLDDMIAAVRDKTHAVVSHGDSWTNNFLYKYEDGIPVDAMMIDFQLARCASPVLDLAFVIYACTDQKLREDHYDALLDYYYECLAQGIDSLGSDANQVYSKQTFLGEVKKYSFFGLAFSFESTPFIVLAPEDAINMEMEGDQKLNIDDVWQVGPFKTKAGRLREANNIKHCVDRGFI